MLRLLNRLVTMRTLRGVHWLLSPAASPEAPNVILWWELRRPLYNLLMLGIGGANLLLFFLVLTAERHLFPALFATPAHPVRVFIEGVPFPVVLAALGANVLYSFGSVSEIAVRNVSRASSRFGPAAWLYGTGLSVLVTFSLLVMNLIGCTLLLGSRHLGGA